MEADPILSQRRLRDGGARVFFDPALQPDRDEALRIERAILDAQALAKLPEQ
jgi:hypothetical protein